MIFLIPDFIIVAFLIILFLPLGLLGENTSFFNIIIMAVSFIPTITTSAKLFSLNKESKKNNRATIKCLVGICIGIILLTFIECVAVYIFLRQKTVFGEAEASITGLFNGIFSVVTGLIVTSVLLAIICGHAYLIVENNSPALIFFLHILATVLCFSATVYCVD